MGIYFFSLSLSLLVEIRDAMPKDLDGIFLLLLLVKKRSDRFIHYYIVDA